MPPKPPKGCGPAVAVQRLSRGAIAAAAAVLVVLALLVFGLSLAGLPAGIIGVAGGAGALTVLLARRGSYAAGEEWLRRGDNSWVVTARLGSARVDGQTLRLRESRRRKTDIKIDVLRQNPALFAAIAGGVHRAAQAGTLSADDSARQLFSLPAGR